VGWVHGLVGLLEEKLGDARYKGWFYEQVDAWILELFVPWGRQLNHQCHRPLPQGKGGGLDRPRI